MNVKNLLYWLVGGSSILLGVLIGGSYELFLGDTLTAVASSLVALLFILFGGLLWIGTSVNIREG